MNIKIIAAVSENGVIGNRTTNSIPWNYPEDIKWFRQQTAGATIILGRKTFNSIGKILPKRRNIIITRSKIDGVECWESIEQALSWCSADEQVWLIGGEQIYRDGLRFADEIFLTLIPEIVNGDVYFPWINPSQFKINDYITLESERLMPLKVAHYVKC
jgi:dihydrofolate reductase